MVVNNWVWSERKRCVSERDAKAKGHTQCHYKSSQKVTKGHKKFTDSLAHSLSDYKLIHVTHPRQSPSPGASMTAIVGSASKEATSASSRLAAVARSRRHSLHSNASEAEAPNDDDDDDDDDATEDDATDGAKGGDGGTGEDDEDEDEEDGASYWCCRCWLGPGIGYWSTPLLRVAASRTCSHRSSCSKYAYTAGK